jgi:hypothetical protein
MVTALVAGPGKSDLRVLVLDGLPGSTPVAELRGHFGLGVLGAEANVRSHALLLKPNTTLADAGLAAGSVVHVCAGEEGGMPGPDMPGIFAAPGTCSEGLELGLVEGIGYLLERLSEDISEIERAVLRLEILGRSGKFAIRRCSIL